MDSKSKTRKPPGRRTKPKESQEAQSERFIETARKLGVDESGEEYERALESVLNRKAPK